MEQEEEEEEPRAASLSNPERTPRIRRRPGLAFLSLFGVAASSRVVRSQPVGCFVYDHAYSEAVAEEDVKAHFGNTSTNPLKGVVSALECQERCTGIASCVDFSYYPISKECVLGQVGGSLMHHDHSIKDGKAWTLDVLAGPRECQEPAAACVENPTENWPGEDREASQAAFATGFQPLNLQCWPRYSYESEATSALKPCSQRSVVADSAVGWPGTCDNMEKMEVPEGKTCESMCVDDTFCSVWSLQDSGECYQGLGFNCYTPFAWDTSYRPNRSQRIVRGQYRVLKAWTGMQIFGLQQVFDGSAMEVTENPSKACRDVCLSVLACQYWQLDNTTGCYIEIPAMPPRFRKGITDPVAVAWPLTTADIKPLATAVAAEYLQRSCPLAGATTSEAVEKASQSQVDMDSEGFRVGASEANATVEGSAEQAGVPWWSSALFVVGALLLLAGIAYLGWFMYNRAQKGKGAKKTRAAKAAKARKQGSLSQVSADSQRSEAPLLQPQLWPVDTTPQSFSAQAVPISTSFGLTPPVGFDGSLTALRVPQAVYMPAAPAQMTAVPVPSLPLQNQYQPGFLY